MEAELIFCEDTRVTKKLLNLLAEKYELDFSQKEFKSFHSHNEKEILNSLTRDTFTKNVVYCSDAGMPCVSDPGATLVDWCIKNEVPYDVIPGANAVITAFAMSGFTSTEFIFFGFLDHKGASRASKLDEVLNSSRVSILYESPHRLLKLIEELNKKEPSRTIFLVKEISKLHQKVYKNSAENLYKEFVNLDIKGEWVVVIEPKITVGLNLELDDILPLDIAPKIKAKLIAKLTGATIKEVYQQLLDKMDK
ncbi:16S rRNA (cytidine(1402)-2'-O)-methyltransferase [Aliarcobacter cibarius]|uniref:16S rRNA (Cytidine(1402)-2'-O)-methyltransferase n=1 Tax=Aliarcobacter cibarius TaxID=255507 RepID=A0A7L5JSG6_9BACT|nr:16S rRNA (cytidine(1402)-2'-O)-methyltransferase [Aliarcobacter cibarius]